MPPPPPPFSCVHLHRKYSIYRLELNHAQQAGAGAPWFSPLMFKLQFCNLAATDQCFSFFRAYERREIRLCDSLDFRKSSQRQISYHTFSKWWCVLQCGVCKCTYSYINWRRGGEDYSLRINLFDQKLNSVNSKGPQP
jgi:hypothetical protein